MNSDRSTPHDDGLKWLRDIRRRMFHEANGDLKKLGDRYRRVQSEHPEKTFDPRQAIANAVREKSGVSRALLRNSGTFLCDPFLSKRKSQCTYLLHRRLRNDAATMPENSITTRVGSGTGVSTAMPLLV